MNYIEGRHFVTFDSNGVRELETDSTSDCNYLFLEKLYQTNKSGNLETYKKLFEEFITDPNLYGFFSYTDHPPSNCKQVFYPLCVCGINEDSLEKVHRGLYEAKCSCVGGKRYIALRNAYEIALGNKSTMCTYQIADLIKENKSSEDIFASNQIIQWIEKSSPRINPLEYFTNKEYTEWVWTKNI